MVGSLGFKALSRRRLRVIHASYGAVGREQPGIDEWLFIGRRRSISSDDRTRTPRTRREPA